MACTTILVGKKASYDGSTMIARTEDSQLQQKQSRLMRVFSVLILLLKMVLEKRIC